MVCSATCKQNCSRFNRTLSGERVQSFGVLIFSFCAKVFIFLRYDAQEEAQDSNSQGETGDPG